MCQILLLDMGTPRREYSEPIGIEVLISYIANKHSNMIIDTISLELDEYSKFEELLNQNKYIIIGISTKIGSFLLFEKVMNSIEQLSTSAVIICGDILATYAYESLLSRYHRLICAIGEGENSIVEIIGSILKYGIDYRMHLYEIKSIAFFDGSIKCTDRDKTFDVTKSLHPTRTFLKKVKEKGGIVHLEASRGCTYGNCSFCGIKQKYHIPRWRPFPIEHIIEELKGLSINGIMSPYFTDEDFFGSDIDRVDRLSDEILRLKANGQLHPEMNFYFNMRVDSVLGIGVGGVSRSTRTLCKLKQAGLREVFIGIESGTDEQIDRYNKDNSPDKCIRAVMLLNRLGIDIDIGFIMFDPAMNLDTLRINIDFIYRTGLSMNYSRLAKRLRIEPYTPYSDNYVKIYPNLRLDLSSVSYDYDFEDQRINDLYKKFYKWEREDLDFIYNLQSFCRGEVPNEDERRKARDIISLYRSLDISLLREICEDTVYNNSDNYSHIFDMYAFTREHYNEMLESEIQRITSTYRK